MSRPVLIERQVYKANLPVEEFMVPVLREGIEEALAALPADVPGFKVLDMGCGGQPFRSALEGRGYRYVSADAQDPMGIVHHVAELDKELPPGLLAEAPFDFILCTEVLEHVAIWEKAFANFAALLKPGGLVLITCPHVYILHEQPYDFWRPTPHAIRAFAQRHGLRERTMRQLGNTWDVIGTLLGASYDAVKRRKGKGSKLGAWFVAKAVRFLFRLLRKGRLQHRYSLEDSRYPVYLTNLALLEKAP